MAAISMFMFAQNVSTHSIYDVDQNNEINVTDVTKVVDIVVNNVSSNQTQQFVTAEDLSIILQSIQNDLKLIKEKLGITEAQIININYGFLNSPEGVTEDIIASHKAGTAKLSEPKETFYIDVKLSDKASGFWIEIPKSCGYELRYVLQMGANMSNMFKCTTLGENTVYSYNGYDFDEDPGWIQNTFAIIMEKNN